MQVILASGSPRRLEIMRKHGIEPAVIVTDVDETIPEGTPPELATVMLARKKAMECFNILKNGASDFELPSGEESIIIAADTVVFKNEIMGKPENAEDAFRMLSELRGTSHQVISGVAIINVKSEEMISFHETTEVFFTDYSDEDIMEYIRSGEPFDKAGAYAIQGGFGKYVEHYEGDYENVVGLPFSSIEKRLKKVK